MRRWIWAAALCWLAAAPLLAQEDCSDLVQRVLDTVGEVCAITERNEVCYGNVSLTAQGQPEAIDFDLDAVGEIESVGDLAVLELEPLDESAGTWGVALMQLQANLPDTMPGQNVLFPLFGDVRIENASAEDQPPMQAVYLTTGLGATDCAGVPESGVMVQTPEGSAHVTFNVNGINVGMGSTVVLRSTPDEEMSVTVLEGAAEIETEDETYPVIAGTEWSVEIDEESQIIGEPEWSPYDPDAVDALPVELLEYEIEIAEPLSEEQIDQFIDWWQSEMPLCSDDPASFLPPCEHLTPQFGGAACVFYDDGSGLPLCDPNVYFSDLGCIYPAAAGPNTDLSLPFCPDACVFPPGPNDPPLPAGWAGLPECVVTLPPLEITPGGNDAIGGNDGTGGGSGSGGNDSTGGNTGGGDDSTGGSTGSGDDSITTDPCQIDPSLCATIDPCVADPASCAPLDPCVIDPASCAPPPPDDNGGENNG